MTDDDLLSSATAALRETSVEGDGAATRLRVRRSLEADHRGRRQLVSFATATSILLAGGMSWAFATGRVAQVWHAIVDPAPVREVSEVREEPVPVPGPVPQEQRAVPEVPDLGPIEETPAPAPAPTPTPAPAPPRTTVPAPTPAPAPRATAPARLATVSPPPVEALYRKAHELHFRGTDHAAAIAAWDAYLAAEPNGRFVAEARYNRALLLIRVGRYAEARAALEPYARGEIANGYRRAEAAQLVERLPTSP